MKNLVCVTKQTNKNSYNYIIFQLNETLTKTTVTLTGTVRYLPK